MCSAEIHEIDNKVANLHKMRKIVLDRLAGLEMDEAGLEQERGSTCRHKRNHGRKLINVEQ